MKYGTPTTTESKTTGKEGKDRDGKRDKKGQERGTARKRGQRLKGGDLLADNNCTMLSELF